MSEKTMTIDELKAEISAVQLLDDIETLEQLTDAILELVEQNRDAIVTDAQRPLRFRKANSFGAYVLYTTNDMPAKPPFGIVIDDKERCKALAKSLGLPCEFIEETNGN